MSQVGAPARMEPGEGEKSPTPGAAGIATPRLSLGMNIAAEIKTQARAADPSATVAWSAAASIFIHHKKAMTMSKLTFKRCRQMACAWTGCFWAC